MTAGMPSGPPPEPPSTPTPVVALPPVPNQIGSRSLWTIGESLVAALIAWIAGLSPEDNPEWFTVVTVAGSGALSAIKSFIATKVGDPGTVTFR